MQTKPNSSSLFPDPSPTPKLRCSSRNVWQTSPLGQLCIILNSILVKLNFSSSVEQLPSHGPVIHCQGYHNLAFVNSEELGRIPQQRTILHPQHHCCGPILQICPLQHPQDLDFPNKRRNTTPGPSAGHLPSGLMGKSTFL